MANQSAIIEGQSVVRKTMTTLMIIFAFLGLAVLGWFANEESKNPDDYAKLPLIAADKSPFKVKPADPGGMVVPNTDIQLYDEIARNPVPKRTDVIDLSDARLSPPPEEPVELVQPVVNVRPQPQKTIALVQAKAKPIAPTANEAPQPEEAKTIAENNEAEANEIVTPITSAINSAEKVVISTGPHNIKTSKVISNDPRYKRIILSGIPNKPSGNAPKAKAVIVKPAKKVVNKIEVSVPAIKRVQKVTAPVKVAPKLLIGSELIQLGSYQSRASVKKGWKMLKSKYPKDLSSLSLSIKTADLGPRGVYYRMLAGPFKDKETAATACKKLISKGQDCLVAR